jgi:hypothetical protein
MSQLQSRIDYGIHGKLTVQVSESGEVTALHECLKDAERGLRNIVVASTKTRVRLHCSCCGFGDEVYYKGSSKPSTPEAVMDQLDELLLSSRALS